MKQGTYLIKRFSESYFIFEYGVTNIYKSNVEMSIQELFENDEPLLPHLTYGKNLEHRVHDLLNDKNNVCLFYTPNFNLTLVTLQKELSESPELFL